MNSIIVALWVVSSPAADAAEHDRNFTGFRAGMGQPIMSDGEDLGILPVVGFDWVVDFDKIFLQFGAGASVLSNDDPPSEYSPSVRKSYRFAYLDPSIGWAPFAGDFAPYSSFGIAHRLYATNGRDTGLALAPHLALGVAKRLSDGGRFFIEARALQTITPMRFTYGDDDPLFDECPEIFTLCAFKNEAEGGNTGTRPRPRTFSGRYFPFEASVEVGFGL